MSNDNLRTEKAHAFKLFSEGKSQKEISLALGISENSISKWKQRYNWLEELDKAGIDKNQPTFLILSEINPEAILSNPEAVKDLQKSVAIINKNLSIIHRILTEGTGVGAKKSS